MARIKAIELPDGNTYEVGNKKIWYGTCATAASTAAKVVSCEGFTAAELEEGTIILVTFSATNSGAVGSLTLNVNNTGAKKIQYINNGTRGNLSSAGYLKADTTYPFIYDGTYWLALINYNSNTTYAAMTESEMQTGTAVSVRSITAERLKQAVEYHAPIQSAQNPLHIDSKKIQLLYHDGTTDRAITSIVHTTLDNISGVRIDYDNETLDGGSVFLPDGAGFSTGSQAIIAQIPTKTSDLTNDSGFITVDEKVKTDLIPSTSATYYLTLSSSDSSQTSTLLKASELSAYYNSGSMLKLILGKDNIAGRIRLYSAGTKYAELGINGSLTNNRTIYLPDAGGTIALTTDIPTVPTNVSAFTNDAGYLTSYTETDPVFSASAAHGISASDITNWNGKQAALVSGTNIKTINNESLLGSGNISISSGLQNLVDGSTTGSVRGVGTKAEGSNYTIGRYAFAEGYSSKASGICSHAEGEGTTASGENSHAEGHNTTASGNYSHAEGYGTTVSGNRSHAEGDYTTASGVASHAQNSYTIAQRKSQTALGEYNIADTGGYFDYTRGNYIVIVGNGIDDSNRSNALTIDWSGNVDIASGAHYKINGTNLSASDVGAQPTLVSGTNIKTINNTSLLGSGNINTTVAMTGQEIEDAVDAGWIIPNTVTISLTNPRYGSEFVSCDIWGLDSDNPPDENAILLGTIDSPTGSRIVQTNKPYLAVYPLSMASIQITYSSSTIITTGDVTWDGNTWSDPIVIFAVDGDGTATINGINYDY